MKLINYTKNFGLFNSGEDGKVNRLGTVLSVGAGAVGLATGAIGLKKALKDGDKFTVVFRSGDEPKKIVIQAEDKISARNKAQTRTNGTDYKAFHNPQENDAAMDYYDSLAHFHNQQ